MIRDRHDQRTDDLLDWTPPEVVDRYEPARIRAVELSDLVSRAVSETLIEAAKQGLDRDEIARQMTERLGIEIRRSTLDAYASAAKADNRISLERAWVLMEVTGDYRLLQMIAESGGRAVIDARYLNAIDDAIIGDQMERLGRLRKQRRRGWKRGRP